MQGNAIKERERTNLSKWVQGMTCINLKRKSEQLINRKGEERKEMRCIQKAEKGIKKKNRGTKNGKANLSK